MRSLPPAVIVILCALLGVTLVAAYVILIDVWREHQKRRMDIASRAGPRKRITTMKLPPPSADSVVSNWPKTQARTSRLK